MRDDSGLYTGASSASLSMPKEQPLRKAHREEKIEKRSQLAPFAEIVSEQLQRELQKLMYAPYVGEDGMSDEQFRTERRARRIAIESISAVQIRLNNILRDDGRKRLSARPDESTEAEA